MREIRTACQDYQIGESALKCLSQGRNRIAREVSNRDHDDYYHNSLTTRPR